MRAERASHPFCPRTSFLAAGFLSLFIVFQGTPAWARATLTQVSGTVEVHSQDWIVVSKTPYPVEPGETIRTTSRANAVLTFEDGSRVELAGNSSFTLEETASSSYSMGLGFGRLKAFVEKIAARRFQVRTPTAVAAVRGTEFQVEVLGDGSTSIDLYKGLLAVDDNHGRQILLHPNETTRINMMGLGASKRTPTRREIQRARFRDMVHGEIAS